MSKAPGLLEIDELRSIGTKPEKIREWVEQRRSQFQSLGDSPEAINEYFGLPVNAPDMRALEEYARGNLEAAAPKTPKTAREFYETGFGMSATGLAWADLTSHRLPEMQVPEDASYLDRFIAGVGGITGDVPAMLVGGLAAAPAAAMAGLSAGTRFRNPFAAAIAAGVVSGGNAFAFPAIVRQHYIDKLSKGEIRDFDDWFSRVAAMSIEGAKGFTTGALSSLAGGSMKAWMTGRALARIGGYGPLTATAQRTVSTAAASSEVATMVAVGKGLNLEVPKTNDFVEAAMLMGAAHSVSHVAGKLMGTWAKTGENPKAYAERAEADPSLRHAMIVEDPNPPAEAGPRMTTDPKTKQAVIDANPATLSVKEATESMTPEERAMFRQFKKEESKQRVDELANELAQERQPAGPDEATLTPEQKADLFYERVRDFTSDEMEGRKVLPELEEGHRTPADVVADFWTKTYDMLPAKMQERIHKAIQDATGLKPGDQIFPVEDTIYTYTGDGWAPMQTRGQPMTVANWNEAYSPGDATPQAIDLRGPEARLVELMEAANRGVKAAESPRPTRQKPPPAAAAAEDANVVSATEAITDVDAAKAAIQKQIVRQPVRRRVPTWEEFMYTRVDRVYPVEKFEKAGNNGKLRAVEESPSQLFHLMNGSAEQANRFITDFVKPILDPLLKDWEEFEQYLTAARNVELEGRQIETGAPRGASKTLVDAGQERFEPAAEALRQVDQKILDLLEGAELISPEGRKQMEELNKNHVPFHRLFDENESAVMRDANRTVPGGVPKKIKGSERQVIEPLATKINNIFAVHRAVAHQQAKRALANLADGESIREVPLKAVPTKLTGKDLMPWLEHHVFDTSVLGDDPIELTVWRHERGALEPGQFTTRELIDGKIKLKVWQTENPILAEAAQGLVPEAFSREAQLFLDALKVPAQMLRTGATAPLDYNVFNVALDQMFATMQSQNGFIPFYDWWQGLKSVAFQDEHFQEYQRSGAGQSTAAGMDLEYAQRLTRSFEKTANPLRLTWNGVKNVWDAWRAGVAIGQVATQVGEFKLARAAGKSIKQAAIEARRVTQDFQVYGAKMRAWNQITAFQGGGIGGLRRTFEQMRDDPGGTALVVWNAIVLPTVLLTLAQKDDPRSKATSRTANDLYFHLHTDSWQPALVDEAETFEPGMRRQRPDGQWEVNKGASYRFKRPHELGVLFGGLVERMLRYANTRDPKAFDGFAKNFLAKFVPIGVPTALVPPMELAANKRLYDHSEVIPSYLEKGETPYKYTQNTTELSKVVAQRLNALPGLPSGLDTAKLGNAISPIGIEHLISGWTGAAGSMAWRAISRLSQKIGAIPDHPEQLDNPWNYNPFYRAFRVRYPAISDNRFRDFREEWELAQKRVKTIENLKASAQFKESIALMQAADSAQYLMSEKGVGGIAEALYAMHKTIDYITADPNATQEEKQQNIDRLIVSRIRAAEAGLQAIREFKKKTVNIREVPTREIPASPEEPPEPDYVTRKEARGAYPRQ